ncbi:MAG: CARDB domain-containing protein [Parabacteroides sp.]|nr:CARDB domain-containing protein [bacterium]MDY4101924.1 CARDB domain-containing protein [Parabacteroides sp.]
MKTHLRSLLWGLLFLFQYALIYAQTDENRLVVPLTDCPVGSTSQVAIEMTNAAEIVAAQFDMYIPTGVHIALTSTEDIKLTDRKNGHVVAVKDQGAGRYTLVITSGQNNAIRGNKGELVTFLLAVDKEAEIDSQHSLKLSNIVLSDKSGQNVASEKATVGTLHLMTNDRPDITVQQISVTPTSLVPGDQVTIQWQVANIGQLPTKDAFKEQLYLVNPTTEDEYFLGELTYTEMITNGATVSRSATYTLKKQLGIDGTVYPKIKLRPYPDLGEFAADAANNEVTGSTSLTIAKMLDLSMPTDLQENKTTANSCILYRSGSVKKAETFTLTNNNAKRLSTPQTVTIEEGSAAVRFTIQTIDNQTVDADSTALVTIAGNDYPEMKQLIWIADDEVPALQAQVDKETIVEGEEVILTVTRHENLTKNPLTVKLTCDHSARFSCPKEVVIPAGEVSAQVKLVSTDNDQPNLTDEVLFTLSAPGYTGTNAFVTLQDNDIPDIELTIEPTILSESSGPQAAIATLKRTKVTNNQITVKLTDTAGGSLYYPSSSIVLEKGMTEYKFSIGVKDDSRKQGDRKVKLTAAVYVSSCSCSTAGTDAGTVEKELTLLDDDSESLKLTTSQTTLLEGKEHATTLTISRNTSTDVPLQVTLTCDKPDEVTFDAAVTIPAGQSSVEVPVSVKKNDTTEGNRTITFTVSADGFSSGVCWAMITDQTLPDATVSVVPTSRDLSTKGEVTLDLTVKNVGAAALPAQTKVEVYLSNRSLLGSVSDKTLLGTYYTQTAIVPNSEEVIHKTAALPDKTGAYYVVATINAAQTVKELNFVNNDSEGVSVSLESLYKVQVSTDKSTYKPGESIVITGQAHGGVVAGVPVDLYVIWEGQRTVMEVTTDQSGSFQKRFTPADYQIGHLSFGACYPGEGLKEEMSGVDVYGMRKTSVTEQNVGVVGKEYKSKVRLYNPGNQKLTQINGKVLSAPNSFVVTFNPIAELNGKQSLDFEYTIVGSEPTDGFEKIEIEIFSAEGASLHGNLYYGCILEQGKLVADVEKITTTICIDENNTFHLQITNIGEGETGNIQIVLPRGQSWMSIDCQSILPSLKKGESVTIPFIFKPTSDLSLNIPMKGTIGVNCSNGTGFSLPFNITPVSSSKGSLKIDVKDEYTYYTEKAPHVKDASVVLYTMTGQILASGKTDDRGIYTFSDVAAGYYKLEVYEDGHKDVFKKDVLVSPEMTTEVEVNLSVDAIRIDWDVTEVTTEDRYEIKTNVSFQTNVPAPVVVMEVPSRVYADQLQPGESLMFNIIMTNRGLITAQDVQILLPTGFNTLEFELLDAEPFRLLPNASVVRPVKVTKKTASLRANLDNDPCVGYPGTLYFWDCGTDRKWHRYEAVLQLGSCVDGVPSTKENSGGVPMGYPGFWFGGSQGKGWVSTTSYDSNYESKTYVPEKKKEDKGCEPCQNKFLLDLVQCIKPVKVVVEGVKTVAKSVKCVNSFTSSKDFADKLKDCPFTDDKGIIGLYEIYKEYDYLIKRALSSESLTQSELDLIMSDFKRVVDTALNDLLSSYTGQITDEILREKKAILEAAERLVKALQGAYDTANPEDGKLSMQAVFDSASELFDSISELLNLFEVTKDFAEKFDKIVKVWKKVDCIVPLLEPCDKIENAPDQQNLRSSSANQYPSYILDFQEALSIAQDAAIAEDEMRREILGDDAWMNVTYQELLPLISYLNEYTSDLLNDTGVLAFKPKGFTDQQMFDLAERWYNSFYLYDESKGNSVKVSRISSELLPVMNKAYSYLEDSGYDNFTDLLENKLEIVQTKLNESQNTVCSSISLSFSQTMVMTRQAFKGTLTVMNGHESVAMKNVRLELEVKDEEGNIATSHEMQITPKELKTFTGELTGEWELAAQQTGSAIVEFIPTKYAAPTEPKVYTFGGTLTYLDPFTNLEVTRDLYPVAMTVNPSPNLKMTYFMQRDLLGDDPLTKEVEAVEPAEFSLLIHNIGAGDGTNIRMTTQQPKIIENEKGLAIEFKMIGSSLNGEDKVLPLSSDGSAYTEFGTIPAGKTSYAQWWFTSSLLGHFVDYDVEATHVTSYGNPDLSLLGDVTIKELIRSIKYPVDGAILTGFMVNETKDANDLPDHIYLSDGTDEPVFVTDQATCAGDNTQYTLIVNPVQAGWNYGSINDPTGGHQKLISVRRVSDGAEISLRNVWLTDRTLRDGKDPLYENRLHFVDRFATSGQQEYILTFEPRPATYLKVVSIAGAPTETVNEPVTELTVTFNKAIDPTTFTVEDLELTCQGTKVDVAGIRISPVGEDHQVFQLDLTEVTKDKDGFFVLTVQTAEIVDMEQFKGETGEQVCWNQYIGGQVTLTFQVSPEEAGTVTPETGQYDHNASVALQATPAKGYRFRSWTINGEVISTEAAYTYTAIGSKTLVANFDPLNYLITVKCDPAEGIMEKGATGSYPYKETVLLEAAPTAGYAFAGWKEDGKIISKNNPYLYTVQGESTVEATFTPVNLSTVTELKSGWNWISVNTADVKDPKVFLQAVLDQVERFQSQTQELVHDPKLGLTGNLTELDPKVSYKLKLSGSGSIEQEGTAIVPDKMSISLHKGWNWLGYIPGQASTPNNVLKNLNASVNDEVKGQDGFAQFNGSGWIGTLQVMEPGKGYMYYAGQNTEFHYERVYATVQNLSLRSSQVSPWSYDVNKYPNNMSMVAKVYHKTMAQEPGAFTVGAFVGKECRGIGQYVEGLLFLTVHGSTAGEKVTFKAYENATGETFDMQESVSFSEATVGNVSQPYSLHLNNYVTGIDPMDVDLYTYPNPVTTTLYIGGDYSQVKRVYVVAINGAVLSVQELGSSNQIDFSSYTDGYYLVGLETPTGYLYKKILKVSNGQSK